MGMDKLKVSYININDIKPYEKNPRNNKEAIPFVAKSIKEFGFKSPIIIDNNNIVVCGHTRLEAAKELGLKEVPCVIADDLTDKQIKAFRIADNKVSDYSIWDNKLLLEELEELNFDIFTGFEESDLFEDIKQLDELDEKDTDVIDDNEEGVVYVIQFKTQDKELMNQIKELIAENEDKIYE